MAVVSPGAAVPLENFPGGDRPDNYRHERHSEYEGATFGYPNLEFEVAEPLAWHLAR